MFAERDFLKVKLQFFWINQSIFQTYLSSNSSLISLYNKKQPFGKYSKQTSELLSYIFKLWYNLNYDLRTQGILVNLSGVRHIYPSHLRNQAFDSLFKIRWCYSRMIVHTIYIGSNYCLLKIISMEHASFTMMKFLYVITQP